jgi:hypothetical protein
MHNGYLIVKIMHGIEKTEFAVPVVDYGLKVAYNWLWGMTKMIGE